MSYIKEFMEQNNLSVKDITDVLEVSDRTVYRWMAGESSPRIEDFIKLQETYIHDEALPEDQIIDETPEINNTENNEEANENEH